MHTMDAHADHSRNQIFRQLPQSFGRNYLGYCIEDQLTLSLVYILRATMDNNQCRVFIVDDDKSFGRSLKRLLIARGFAVEHFESATAFLDSVPSDQAGFAIVDIHMPDFDGLSLIERMQEMKYSVPVIAITGQTAAGLRDRALHLGAVGFLQKPFVHQSLLSLIETPQRAEDKSI